MWYRFLSGKTRENFEQIRQEIVRQKLLELERRIKALEDEKKK